MGAQDVLTSEWAIIPEKLAEIQAVYVQHLHNENIDLHSIETRLGKPLNNERKPYQVVNGVALVEITGIIAKKMNLLTQISGGVSTQLLKRDFEQAFADPEVKAIILVIDSPGGTVDGTEELANAVFRARQEDTKPIISYVDGLMASAAYWIGAAANRIYINGNTAQVGSIGVVATHVDYSKYEEKQGIKTTEIYAGKYKRIASEYQPLSKEGRGYIQDRVDYFYSIFVNTVERFRQDKLKISDDNLIPWADGKIFIGRQGIDAGLADGIMKLEELVSNLSRDGRGMFVQAEVAALMEERFQQMINTIPPTTIQRSPAKDLDSAIQYRLALLDRMKKHGNPLIRLAHLDESAGHDFNVIIACCESFPNKVTCDQMIRAFNAVYPRYKDKVAVYVMAGL